MLDSVAQAQALDECAKKAFLLCVQDGMVAGSMDRSERQRCGRLIKLLKAETERAHYLRQYVASMHLTDNLFHLILMIAQKGTSFGLNFLSQCQLLKPNRCLFQRESTEQPQFGFKMRTEILLAAHCST